MDRLNRFNLIHGRCGGGPIDVSEPVPEDVTDDGMWVTACCPGCGATIRELVPPTEMFANLPRLLEAIGSSWDEFQDAIARGDEAMVTDIQARLTNSPEATRLVLRSIRQAGESEARN
jgi:hypothetical protein